MAGRPLKIQVWAHCDNVNSWMGDTLDIYTAYNVSSNKLTSGIWRKVASFACRGPGSQLFETVVPEWPQGPKTTIGLVRALLR